MFTPSVYQQAIFDWITNGTGNAVVCAVAGCLSGATMLGVSRARRSSPRTIADVYFMHVGGIAGGKRWDRSVPTRLRSLLDDNIIGLQDIADVVYSGEKTTYAVTTQDGKYIRATQDHQFLTPGGWKRLSELSVGDCVVVDSGAPKATKRPRKEGRRDYPQVSSLHAHPYKAARGTHSNSVPLHRIVAEASLNEMRVDEYIERIRAGEIDGLLFIDTALYHVHHKDEDVYNNCIDNLEILTKEDHLLHHAHKDGWKHVQARGIPSQIASIVEYGIEPTYDITMADGARPNFLADGFVVHNSGKTTTLEQAAKLLPADKSAVFVAFNNHIVAELKNRLKGTSMVATTVHSAGRSALAKAVKLQGEPDTRKYRKIVRDILVRRRLSEDYETVSIITKLVDQARNSLTDPANLEALWSLAVHFDLAENLQDWMLSIVNVALNEGETQARNAGLIDFTDMLYLPVRWNLTPAQSDVVFGDEIQDWSPVQLEIVVKMLRPGGRFLGVGDPAQSIMAFAGADDESFWKIKSRLHATELPLSVCYRCPKSHVKLAQEYVSAIQPFEAKPEGTISYAKDADLFKLVKTGDLILCRKTAPLVKNCIALIGAGVAARVRGRNIGKTLTELAKTVSKLPGFTVDQFPKFLDEYRDVQVRFLAQKEDSEEQIENLNDRCAALEASFRRYYSLNASFEAILGQIEGLFSDDNPGVWLSTIHRAKGLEADRVMILEYDNIPMQWKNQQPYQYAQECNLVYVALTRAKQELILFGQTPLPEPKPVEAAITEPLTQAELCKALTVVLQPVEKKQHKPRKPSDSVEAICLSATTCKALMVIQQPAPKVAAPVRQIQYHDVFAAHCKLNHPERYSSRDVMEALKVSSRAIVA